eukprot:GDKI01044919.1.p1 GENE.GDKI01044919.1~~GDKI01044919.1.p1  ORF type:complete len:537 (+),score=122.60 GDKI01044919.1:158-1612(+)
MAQNQNANADCAVGKQNDSSSVLGMGDGDVHTHNSTSSVPPNGCLQTHYRNIVDTHTFRTFSPPWWAKNRHVQTVYGSGALMQKIRGGLHTQERKVVERFRRQRWETPDGDFFDVDFLMHEETALAHAGDMGTSSSSSNAHVREQSFFDMCAEYCSYPSTEIENRFDRKIDAALPPICIIMHGLEGNSRSGTCARLAKTLFDAGFDVVLPNFRSCSGEDSRHLRAYHVGFTTDLNFLTRRFFDIDRRRRYYITGFSLGGNVTTKFLGELGDTETVETRSPGDAVSPFPSRNIFGGCTWSVPLDPYMCQPVIDAPGFNRWVYAGNFLKTLKRKATEANKRFPGQFDLNKILQAKSIYEFDHNYIAPVWGYTSAQDYYIQNRGKKFLSKIKVPYVCINAIDDPFIDPACLPTQEQIDRKFDFDQETPSPEDTETVSPSPPPPVRLVYHAHGGHGGFLSGCVEGNWWLPREICQYFLHVDKQMCQLL